MNFNRYRCQEFIESEVGCTDPTQLGRYIDQILAYELPLAKVDELRDAISVDSESLFYKSILSFLEAMYGIVNGHSSWAIVKLYYSTFYSLRCKLLTSGYAPIKNGKGNIFFLKCRADEKPSKVPGKERGDHKVTIKAFSHFLSHTLLTNTVDGEGVGVFHWMMDYRELVNYRVDTFIEPEFGYDVIPSFSNPDELEIKLSNYIDDENLTYCFLSSHCVLATPFVLLCEAYNEMVGACNDFSISDDRKIVLRNIIEKIGLSNSGFISEVFDL